MGLVSVKWVMSMPREQKRRRRRQRQRWQVQGHDGSVASLAKRKGSPCQQQDDHQDVKRMRNPWRFLPEDIWYHIHSLLPLQDDARTACMSHTFLRSWRCRPNLVFSKKTLGLNDNSLERDKVINELNEKIDHIMKKHSGIGLRTLGLNHIIWTTPVILTVGSRLLLHQQLKNRNRAKYYDFPFSLLFNRGRSSIKHLCLSYCAFRPTSELNCLQRLHLYEVCITGDELGCFLSNSFALEQLGLADCKELNYLKIPCLLQRLSELTVYESKPLQMMEIKAPNLSTFHFDGILARLSDGGLPPVKNLYISSIYMCICDSVCLCQASIHCADY